MMDLIVRLSLNDIQHDDTQYNDIQPDATQNNDIQHNGLNCET
jgi:hypothetical protein